MTLQIPKQYKSLHYEHDIKWQDIFAVWRAYEAYQKIWREHWLGRGFKSWDEWRQNYITPLEPETKQWSIWRVENPWVDFPQIYGVPSRGWQKNVYPSGVETLSLRDILKLIKADQGKNEKVEEIRKNFPYQTMLTGIIWQDKIILVEGMHRALALASMPKEKMKGDVVLALAEHKGELPVIGKAVKK